MCERFTSQLTWQQVHNLYNIAPQADLDLKPCYNVAPSQKVLVVRLDKDGQRELIMLRWGLILSWATDPKIGLQDDQRARREKTH
jgi:putative SOS response-associated peptidase YedK